MDQLLALIIPPIVGVITYVVLRLLSKHTEIDVLRHVKRDESGFQEAIRLGDPSADSQIETGHVYATLSESTRMSVVRFEDGSLRRHMLDLVTMCKRALTRWRGQQMADIESQKKIERRLAATILSSTPAKPNWGSAKDHLQEVCGTEKTAGAAAQKSPPA